METSKIDSNVLIYYLQHVRGFLLSQKKIQAFPGVAKDIEDVLVQIAGHDTFFPCQGFDDDCKTLLMAIKTELLKQKNVYEIRCTFQDASGTRSLVYTKNKISFKQPLPLRKPNSITSTKTPSSETLSPLINTAFKIRSLNATLKFIKDDSTLTLRYPDMSTEQADFIVNMFEQSNTESGIGLGFKTLYAPIWEAMKIFGLKYKFTLRYGEPKNHEMKCLVLDKIPIISKTNRENQDQQTDTPPTIVVTLTTDNTREITDNTRESTMFKNEEFNKQKSLTNEKTQNKKLNRDEVKKLSEMNALTNNKYPKILQVLENFSHEYITELLKKIHTFIMDEQSASLVFEVLTMQEVQVISSYRTLCCKPKYLPYLNEEGQVLARQIADKLEEKLFEVHVGMNKFSVYAGQVRKCKRLRDTMFQTVTLRKTPVSLRKGEKALSRSTSIDSLKSSTSINSSNSTTSIHSQCSPKQNLTGASNKSETTVKEMGLASSKPLATTSNIKPATTSSNTSSYVASGNNNVNKNPATISSTSVASANNVIIKQATSSDSTISVASDNNIFIKPRTTSSKSVASANNIITKPATSSNSTESVASGNNIIIKPTTTSSKSVASANNIITKPATSTNSTESVASGNNIIIKPATPSSKSVASANNIITKPATSTNSTESVASGNNIIIKPATPSSKSVASANNIITKPATSSNSTTSVVSGDNIVITPSTTSSNTSKSVVSGKNWNKIKQKLIEGMNQPVNSDKAMKMMMNMGWTGGALGVRGEGIIEPITPGIDLYLDNKKRLGLGGAEVLMEQNRSKQKPVQELTKKQYHTNSIEIILKLLTSAATSQEIELPMRVFQREWSFVIHLVHSFNKRCRQDLGDMRQSELVSIINGIMASGNWVLSAEGHFDRCVIIIKKTQKGEYVSRTIKTEDDDTTSVYPNNGKTMKKVKGSSQKPVILNIPKKPVILKTDENDYQNFTNLNDLSAKRETSKPESSVPNAPESNNQTNCVKNTTENLNNTCASTVTINFQNNFLADILFFCKQEVLEKTLNFSNDLNKDEKAYILDTMDALNRGIKCNEIENSKLIEIYKKIHSTMNGYTLKCYFHSARSINLEKHYSKMSNGKARGDKESHNNNIQNNNNTSLIINKNIRSENNRSQVTNDNDQEVEYICIDGAKYNSIEDVETSLLIRSVSNNNNDIDLFLNDGQSCPVTNNSSPVIINSDQEMDDISVVVASDDEEDLLNSDDDITKSDLAKEFQELRELYEEEKSTETDKDVPKDDLNNKNGSGSIEEEEEVDEKMVKTKRPLSESESSSQENKKTKHFTKEIAIAPKNHPEKKMTEETAREIQISIRNSIDNTDSSELPLLKCNGLQNGMLLYCCYTEKSVYFIEDLLKNTAFKIIYGVSKENCTCVKKEDYYIRMTLRINSFFVENTDVTFKRLVKYNQGLNTDKWNVAKRFTHWKTVGRLYSRECDVFLVEMDESSYNYIKDAKFSLFAGIDKVVFKHYWD